MSVNLYRLRNWEEQERMRNRPPSAEVLAEEQARFKKMRHHFGILKQGVDAWNHWREANPTVIPSLSGYSCDYRHHYDLFKGVDLRGANLSGAEMWGAYLSGMDLTDTCFRGARLGFAHFKEACLHRADLSRTNLCDAHLEGADLHGVDLSRSDLRDAHLEGADIRGADLRRVNLRCAHLEGADISQANLRYANLKLAYLDGVKSVGTRFFGARFDRHKGTGCIYRIRNVYTWWQAWKW